jgi:16S rRNA (guanine527-N7)-methyltransferase
MSRVASGDTPPSEHGAYISWLAGRYGLSPEATTKLRLLLECLAGDPAAPTSIRDPRGIVDRHFADSLVALELEPVRHASLALDLGSGPGMPGLALAAALPHVKFVLLESAARKCDFLERAIGACGISNGQVVHDRAESYAGGRGRHDLVTARAVASLEVTAEYAAPLLRVGGVLVAWGGKRSSEAEIAAKQAAVELGFDRVEVRRVEPFPQARHRHLYLTSKVTETPKRFPRRPGVALKRPLGSSSGARRSSDRLPR